jgi:O-antigen ligase
LVGGVFFISFVSNFRVRFLVSLIGLIGYFLFINPFKGAKLKTMTILLLIGGMIFFTYKTMIRLQGFSVVERFFLEDKTEDVNTIRFRIGMLTQAYDIGLKSPIFGVGLGNFYDNLPLFGKKNIYTISPLKTKDNLSLLQHPHNSLAQTFVESGLFGLLAFLLLLGYFVKEDVEILFGKENNLEKALIVGFWSLFVYSLFTPPQILVYYVHFWLLRILIEKIHNKNVIV